MNEGILHLIQDFGGYARLIPTSKNDFLGIDDIYTDIQLQFKGGEDLMKD